MGQVMMPTWVWVNLAKAAYRQTSIDEHAFVAKRRGWAKTQGECRDAIERWLSENRTVEELAGFVVDVLLCAQHGISTGSQKWNEHFQETAEYANVDLAKIEAAIPAAQQLLDILKQAMPLITKATPLLQQVQPAAAIILAAVAKKQQNA